MKKLLTVLICVLFGVTGTYARVAKVTAHVAEGEGFVAATTSSTAPAYSGNEWGKANVTKDDGSWTSKGTVYAHALATPESGYAFSHWKTSSGTNSTTPYKVAASYTKEANETVSA